MPEPAKPTPGPWRVDTTKVFGPYHVITVSEDVIQAECIVCAFPSYRRKHKEHRPRLEADARLIAASPKLLAACRRMVEALSVHHMGGKEPFPGDGRYSEALDGLYSAIEAAANMETTP